MKRFYREVSIEPADGGWRVLLDQRPIRTQGGRPQVVPSEALAEMLAGEWRAQGETLDPNSFPLRDIADLAIDQVEPDPLGATARLMAYAETDTLCYRADPDEPVYRRQQAVWEPVLNALEARQGVRLERVSGVLHRPQPAPALERLRAVLQQFDPFTLAALGTMAPLTSSLATALAALEADADAAALFAAANLEQDWQAELWGWDAEAEKDRASRLAAFEAAARVAQAVRS
jgi:chaperone required for assembly of F1-ATPase